MLNILAKLYVIVGTSQSDTNINIQRFLSTFTKNKTGLSQQAFLLVEIHVSLTCSHKPSQEYFTVDYFSGVRY